jgi:hypothetical protein
MVRNFDVITDKFNIEFFIIIISGTTAQMGLGLPYGFS